MEIDIDIYTKNGILFLDYGYVRIGDIYRLIDKLDGLVDDLPKPFQSISLYERAIEKNCLPTPDDRDSVQAFSDFMEKKGRDYSVWVLPGNNMLFRTLHDIADKRDAIGIARTVEEAEEIIAVRRDALVEKTHDSTRSFSSS